jgi:hypothetical protein
MAGEIPTKYDPKDPKTTRFADGLIGGAIVITPEGGLEIGDDNLVDSLTAIEAEGGTHPLTPLARAFRLGVRHAVDRLALQPGLSQELNKVINQS